MTNIISPYKEKPPVKLNENQLKCLKALMEYYNEDGNCVYFRTIVKKTGLTLKQVRLSVRALARKGLAEYHKGLFSMDDGMVAGSGYCASFAGAMMLESCKDCKTKLSAMDTGQCDSCWENDRRKALLSEMEAMKIPTAHLLVAYVSAFDMELILSHYKDNGVPKRLTPAKVLAQLNKIVKPYSRHYTAI
jgi:hypothetical protein